VYYGFRIEFVDRFFLRRALLEIRVESIRVVAFTGMPGAGKSEAVRVARDMGAQVLRMGDAVWTEVKERGLPLEASVVGRVASEMRESHGADVWARRTIEAVDRSADIVVIDGLRTRAELATFREALGGDFVLVLIDCPDEVRLERVTARARDDDTLSREAFFERDERELGWGLGAVLEAADVVIDNTGSVEELHGRVRTILEGHSS
jgi:dephospho-CoA kinase